MDSIVARHEMLRFECVRFGTFYNWNEPIAVWKLVKAGFYYNDSCDMVYCFSCGLMVSGWSEDDEPLEDHKEFMPNCPFIIGLDKSIPFNRTNLPGLSEEQVKKVQPFDASIAGDEVKIIPRYETRIYKEMNFIFPMKMTLPHVPNPAGIMDVEVFFAKMSLTASRYQSFMTAAPYHFIGVDKKALVDSGFFCLLLNDFVQCHACRCVIGNWSRNVEPDERHLQVAPKCTFIRKKLSLACVNIEDAVNNMTCKICLEKQVNITLVPCGHCFCDVCFSFLEGRKTCALCRNTFTIHHKIYLI